MPEPGYTCETVNCDKIHYCLGFSDNQLIAGTQSLCNRFSFALMLKFLVVSLSYHAASLASVNFAIVSKEECLLALHRTTTVLGSFFRILSALLSYLLVYSRILISEIALIPENRLQECSEEKTHLKFENQNMAFPFCFACSSGFQAVLWNKNESEIYFGVGWIQLQFGQTCQLFCTGQAEMSGFGLAWSK